MNRVGLLVARFQMLHKGHTSLLQRVVEDFDTVIVGLGSTGRSREMHDPWTENERRQMITNVYGNRVKIVPLTDIQSEQGSNDWVDYVLSKVSKIGLPEPTDYFSGSISDASWYRGRFLLEGDRQTDEMFTSEGILRKLHIQDRSKNIYPAATELRELLRQRRDEWKQWVPAVNWDLVESTYPDNFRVRV